MLAGVEEELLTQMTGNPFPPENLPYGVFSTADDPAPRIGVAIDDRILDLGAARLDGLGAEIQDACAEPDLNALMSLGRPAWLALRARLQVFLQSSRAHTVPQADATMHLPARIGDYTDFYASLHHATNVGRLFRFDNPLLPNYKYVPIGYHGRASSVVISGTAVTRPCGQLAGESACPTFGPSKSLDYEVEVGTFIGPGNKLGEPIPATGAENHIFGLCLLNDWSARDVQTWEYQPLGPFLSKSFATSISPWVVTMDALEPFRVPPFRRAEGDPAPLPYLQTGRSDGIDLHLECLLLTAKMRFLDMAPLRLSRSNLRSLYWTLPQLITHHASNGCNLRPGDLIGSGTVSGSDRQSMGCLLEMTRRGAEPVELPSGESRRFLEDGDEVIMRGWCERPGVTSIGFGECRGRVVNSV
jgi:fumarylacetoacetase